MVAYSFSRTVAVVVDPRRRGGELRAATVKNNPNVWLGEYESSQQAAKQTQLEMCV